MLKENSHADKTSTPSKPEKPLPEIPLVHKKEYYGDSVAEVTTVIRNKGGVYARRPAILLTQTAMRFNSKIQLKAKNKSVDAKSILMIVSLGLARGTEITISASGSDASEAVKTLVKLIDDGFGEF